MSKFEPSWLALREPADARARCNSGAASALRAWCRGRDAVRLVDLGAGTGANARFLMPALGGRQQWRLVDSDLAVLDEVCARMHCWAPVSNVAIDNSAQSLHLHGTDLACTVRSERLDLATDLDSLGLAQTDVVTASALIDLVSPGWMGRLIERCAEHRVAVLFALTYDGRVRFDPDLEEDHVIRSCLNRHQLRDKGFGPAMGPRAIVTTRDLLEQQGYAVRTWASPWRLGLDDDRLQTGLVADWASAAGILEPTRRALFAHWKRSRLALVGERRSTLEVGHTDLFACPGDCPRRL